MKRILAVVCCFLSCMIFVSCGSKEGPPLSSPPSSSAEAESGASQPVKLEEDGNVRTMQITVGGQNFSVNLEDNEAARALVKLLPVTLDMSEMNGNEKYCYLSDGLPSSPILPSGIQQGELMLYGDRCLVLFYKSFSTSYAYTPLGVADDPAGLAEALGSGGVQAAFALE